MSYGLNIFHVYQLKEPVEGSVLYSNFFSNGKVTRRAPRLRIPFLKTYHKATRRAPWLQVTFRKKTGCYKSLLSTPCVNVTKVQQEWEVISLFRATKLNGTKAQSKYRKLHCINGISLATLLGWVLAPLIIPLLLAFRAMSVAFAPFNFTAISFFKTRAGLCFICYFG